MSQRLSGFRKSYTSILEAAEERANREQTMAENLEKLKVHMKFSHACEGDTKEDVWSRLGMLDEKALMLRMMVILNDLSPRSEDELCRHNNMAFLYYIYMIFVANGCKFVLSSLLICLFYTPDIY